MKYADLFHLKPVQVALLIVALTVAFLLGRCSGPEPPEEPRERLVSGEPPQPVQREEKKEAAVAEKSEPVEAGICPLAPLPVPKTVSLEAEQYDFTEQCQEALPDSLCWCTCVPEPLPFLRPKVVPEVFLGYDDSACAGDLVPAVQATVQGLEAQGILYGVGPLSDCSGIFHRVLKGVKKRCPDYRYPSLQRYRDSRELARWYHEQGELVLIGDAQERTDLIRPGMVLFYGRNGVDYTDFTVEDLVASRAGIDHVGVIVSVATDEDGEVSSYKLFHGHGRRGKTTASATNWHKREPTRASYPPFGNGRQQLVAAARIVRPVKMEEGVETSQVGEEAWKGDDRLAP